MTVGTNWQGAVAALCWWQAEFLSINFHLFSSKDLPKALWPLGVGFWTPWLAPVWWPGHFQAIRAPC